LDRLDDGTPRDSTAACDPRRELHLLEGAQARHHGSGIFVVERFRSDAAPEETLEPPVAGVALVEKRVSRIVVEG
jgi:hypothetical protein